MADPIFDLNMNKYGINMSELNLTKDDFNEIERIVVNRLRKKKVEEGENSRPTGSVTDKENGCREV